MINLSCLYILFGSKRDGKLSKQTMLEVAASDFFFVILMDTCLIWKVGTFLFRRFSGKTENEKRELRWWWFFSCFSLMFFLLSWEPRVSCFVQSWPTLQESCHSILVLPSAFSLFSTGMYPWAMIRNLHPYYPVIIGFWFPAKDALLFRIRSDLNARK